MVFPTKIQAAELFLNGSANGAGTCASAAGNASLSIDNVLTVAGRDRADGALSFTSTASNASILNNVGHGDTSYNIDNPIIPHFTQIAIVNLQFL